MREIKFRAWDKENKKMFEPIYRAYEGKLRELILNMNGSLCMRTLGGALRGVQDDFILMQYTGFKDKNGKEIFEGDIVKLINASYSGEIQWAEAEYLVVWPEETISLHDYMDDEIEVIGNIYENSKLLN